jgi:hypothetical protein
MTAEPRTRSPLREQTDGDTTHAVNAFFTGAGTFYLISGSAPATALVAALAVVLAVVLAWLHVDAR